MAEKILDSLVPVTVLTGFLGSGKTTLLNRILSENHGRRIAVIENEFGEIGIDNELVIGAEEEIFEMNNGCICCTVRGDLIRILGNLMKRRDKFDYIMIETTGMADPGPVAQTFFMDDELKAKLKLDAIVTMIDAKHVRQHIDHSAEVKEQIAFADVILINKTDLVPHGELDALESRIKSMNSAARIYRTKDAAIDMDKVLNIGGFDLSRALGVDPKFMEPEYPFEWTGAFELDAGRYEFSLYKGPDPAMSAALFRVPQATRAALLGAAEQAVLVFSSDGQGICSGESIKPAASLLRLDLSADNPRFGVEIAESGYYALFTEHHPDEFKASLTAGGIALIPAASREFKPDHEHDEEVSSVGITTPADLDMDKFSQWLRGLLSSQGADIFRMKGILSFKGQDERFVFQGVHMLFDGRPDRPWGGEPRKNSLIFIGRNLDRKALNEGFNSCLAG